MSAGLRIDLLKVDLGLLSCAEPQELYLRSLLTSAENFIRRRGVWRTMIPTTICWLRRWLHGCTVRADLPTAHSFPGTWTSRSRIGCARPRWEATNDL